MLNKLLNLNEKQSHPNNDEYGASSSRNLLSSDKLTNNKINEL